MDQTSVINIKDAPDGWETDERYVYIGRAMTRGAHKLGASPYANPFKEGAAHPDTLRPMSREDAIALFRAHGLENAEFIERVRRELKWKILVCWCKPKACHGDILAAWADAAKVVTTRGITVV